MIFSPDSERYDPTPERRDINNLFQYGRVVDVDYTNLLIRVGCYYDENDQPQIVTDWIPWAVGRSGQDSQWWPPSINEGVLLLSPTGNLSSAIALLATYQEDTVDEADRRAGLHKISYGDGLTVEYDQSTHTLNIDAGNVPEFTLKVSKAKRVLLQGSELIHQQATDQILLDGNVIVTGNLYVAGQMVAWRGGSAQPLYLQGSPIHLNPGGDVPRPPDWPFPEDMYE